MADRVIRAALLRSKRWNAGLYDAETQLLFVRLALIVDDFGCFDGREAVIASQAYPLGGGDTIGDPHWLSKMLHDLHAAGLIIRYSNNGHPFIGIPQWSWPYRLKRLFPAPPLNLDQRDTSVRPKYGKTIDWRNPDGWDEVSVLLDLDGTPAVPQPKEWRRVSSDYAPVTAKTNDRRVVTASDKDVVIATAANAAPAMTASLDSSKKLEVIAVSSEEVSIKKHDVDVVGGEVKTPVTATQSLQTNGKISWANGDWIGISEDQRIRWQSMFSEVSIPDQLDRAAAWLQANPKERDAVQRDHGEEAFIVRWLLRETRGRTVSAKGGVDA